MSVQSAKVIVFSTPNSVFSCLHATIACESSSNFRLSVTLELMRSRVHARCESCIDRLFTLGPAPCPICGKVLRKMAFIPQTFEDLAVEKEVAVRRRITKQCAPSPHLHKFSARVPNMSNPDSTSEERTFLTYAHTMTT